jgi:A/G-specific adenine glycosylase
MEIGALICKPSLPSCIHCPLTENCKAFKRKDFIINYKNKFSKTKYFQANVSKYKNEYLLTKNKKFNFLKNLVIFPMEEIDEKKFKNSVQKKINIKMSNMNMKIIINENTKIKKTNNSIFLSKKNINKFILPSFTKKIFNSVS